MIVAVGDGYEVVVADDCADLIVAADVAFDKTVFNGATVIFTDNAADEIIAFDVARRFESCLPRGTRTSPRSCFRLRLRLIC